MQTIGQIPGVSNNNIVVKGTGDPDRDDAKLSSAVAKLNSLGNGTLWIDGQVYLKNSQNFTAPINLRGVDNNAEIIVDRPVGVFSFSWNQDFSIFSQTNYDISIDRKRAQAVSLTGTGFTPASGQWIALWSEDTITGVEPHSNAWVPKPMEMHQISNWDQSNNAMYFSDFIVDNIQTDGKFAVLPMMNDIKVDNLVFSREGDNSGAAKIFFFVTCNNVQVSNIRSKRNGPGELLFNFCSNVKVSNIVIEGNQDNNVYYGVDVGCVNGFIFENSVVYGTRHVFTTTSAATKSSPSRRYGTPLNVKVNNVIHYNYPEVSPNGVTSSRLGFDTHAEGWGIEFNDCTSILSAASGIVGYGFQTRSRNTLFNNCRVIGNGQPGQTNGAYGIQILGNSGVVKNCYIDGCWRGIRVYETFNGGIAGHNCTIQDSIISNCHNQAILLAQTKNNHRIIGNTFYNCNYLNSSDGIIEIEGGTGHEIYNNHLIKGSNNIAINRNSLTIDNVKIINNTFGGYSAITSSGPLGINPTPSGVLFEREYLSKNHTDTGISSRKDGQDSYGTISGTATINFNNFAYDNIALLLIGNLILTLSTDRPGVYNLIVSQDATGNRTITWANVNWSTTPVLGNGSFEVSALNLYFDGSNWYGLSYYAP